MAVPLYLQTQKRSKLNAPCRERRERGHGGQKGHGGHFTDSGQLFVWADSAEQPRPCSICLGENEPARSLWLPRNY